MVTQTLDMINSEVHVDIFFLLHFHNQVPVHKIIHDIFENGHQCPFTRNLLAVFLIGILNEIIALRTFPVITQGGKILLTKGIFTENGYFFLTFEQERIKNSNFREISWAII